jgi:hypothetical protein
MDHTWIADRIRATERAPQPGDALEACVADALQVGSRVVPQPTGLSRAFVEAMWRARGAESSTTPPAVQAMSWEKLPPVNAGAVACRNCGCGAHSDLEMDRVIAVGFGSAGYSRDGETLWSEDHAMDESEYPTVAHVEELAKADPDHDWRIFFYAPLYEAEYQRQWDKVWVLVRKGEGFA